VLVVSSGAGTAVVSGDAPLDGLWDVAARIQAGTGDSDVEPVARVESLNR